MKKLIFITVVLLSASFAIGQNDKPMKKKFAIVIHGGAGTILKKNLTKDQQLAYEQKLQEALDAGYKVLENGGSSTNAVIEAIKILEDSPLFNAGKGAVFTNSGHNEMDASIMEGKTQSAGAVSGVRKVKNPITAARAVMDKSQHVMLSGKGADEFAQKQGLEIVEPSYFFSPQRMQQLKRIINTDTTQLDHIEDDQGYQINPDELKDSKYGTVGAVALDQNGNITAATSTGGMTNKKYGRIGDSPIIGAGTYANDQVGVSCTGHGEYFIRKVVAYDVAALMEYKKMTLQEAAKYIVHDKLIEFGGSGGLIALDKDGNIVMPFNTKGMYRGYKKSSGENVVKLFGD